MRIRTGATRCVSVYGYAYVRVHVERLYFFADGELQWQCGGSQSSVELWSELDDRGPGECVQPERQRTCFIYVSSMGLLQ